MRVNFQPSRCEGTVTVPPSKSMAHRTLICAALAEGESIIENLAFSQDIEATIRGLCAFGARVERLDDSTVRVQGMGWPKAPAEPIDCGESGSTLRFFIPLAALVGQPVRFVGHGRLMERPQNVYEEIFAQKGVHFSHTAEEIVVDGTLPAGEYRVDGSVSSQFITGLLLALSLLKAPSTLTVTPPFESASYVALTCAAMADCGVVVEQQDNTFCIKGNEKYTAKHLRVEGDWSQAAFFAVPGSILGGICVQGLREDSLQGDRVVLDILRRCGARFTQKDGVYCFEKSALHATEIDLADCPDLGPVLMAMALFCEGETHFIHARRLRIKESDRIAAMECEIRKMGGVIRSTEDEVYVTGGSLHTAELDSHNDHRIAMAMAAASMASGVPVVIDDAQAVRKSYANFWDDAASLGVQVERHETA